MDPTYILHFAYWAVCTTGITASVVLAFVVLWTRPRRYGGPTEELPAITVLKPFDGVEHALEDNFWSTVSAPYAAPRQVLFCTGRDNPEGIRVVEAIQARLEREPRDGIEVELLLPAEDEAVPVNRKIWHLQRGLAAARHEVVVSADSGTRLTGDELTAVVQALCHDDRCGIAWAPSTSDGGGTLGSRLSHLAISASTLSFHVIAGLHRVLGKTFLSGALFAVRRTALDQVGQFEAFQRLLAEDLDMGRQMVEHGWTVTASPVPVVQNVDARRVGEFYGRILRWCVIMWQYRVPMRVHYPMVMCSLALAAITLGPAWWAYPEKWLEYLIIGGALLVCRWAYAALLLMGFNRRPFTLDLLWGAPLMEAVMLVAYVHALFVKRVRWRGREFKILGGGRIEPTGS